MSVVGAFPGFSDLRRRTIRAPVNPADKATVISIYPKKIAEVKYTISPGYFEIPPGTEKKPSILIVGPSSWWREIDENQPLLEIPNSAIQIADSLVRDFCNGLLSYIPDNSSPGIGYVAGEFDLAGVREKFPHVLTKLIAMQREWYKNLVLMTNTLWARSNGNPLVVSDDARLAAKELAMENLDWMQDFQAMDMIRCFACGNLRNPKFPLCMHCHTIDMSHPEAKNLVFAPGHGSVMPPQTQGVAGLDPDFGKNQKTKG